MASLWFILKINPVTVVWHHQQSFLFYGRSLNPFSKPNNSLTLADDLSAPFKPYFVTRRRANGETGPPKTANLHHSSHDHQRRSRDSLRHSHPITCISLYCVFSAAWPPAPDPGRSRSRCPASPGSPSEHPSVSTKSKRADCRDCGCHEASAPSWRRSASSPISPAPPWCSHVSRWSVRFGSWRPSPLRNLNRPGRSNTGQRRSSSSSSLQLYPRMTSSGV